VTEIASIDLVVPTVGRTAELERLLESVAAQTWEGQVRVVLVDQNADDRLAPVVERHARDGSILVIRSEPGVSRACNAGFARCTADVIGRVDDDCWYDPGVLGQVARSFDEHAGWDALCGITCDESRRPTQLRWDRTPGVVDRSNIFRRAIGSTLFIRRPAAEMLGPWDESFGPRPDAEGRVSGGSEDGEYILRAISTGVTLGFDPSICIYHADFKPATHDHAAMRKAYSYGRDHARLLQKYDYPRRYVALRAGELLAASAVFLLRGEPGRARFYTAMARGRLAGMIAPATES
jgi:glycosyltransferase involved in cell wall biosynthesis